MDPIEVIYITTAVTYLIAIPFGLVSYLSRTYRKTRYAWEGLLLDLIEVETLRLILLENRAIIDSVGEIPHAAHYAYGDSEQNLQHVLKLWQRMRPPRNIMIGMAQSLLGGTNLESRKWEWVKALDLFKTSVFLLRDICSDIKTQMQITELGVVMARLDNEFVSLPSSQLDATSMQDDTAKTRRYPRWMVNLHDFHYSVVVYVLAGIPPNPSEGPADTETSSTGRLVPATLKLDTGAEVDLVSKDFVLGTLGIEESGLIPIPEAEQFEVVGFEGTKYKPEHRVILGWSRDAGGKGLRTKEFLVVHDCPVEIVLGYQRFLEEAALTNGQAFLVGRPKKTKTKVKWEKEREREEREANIKRIKEEIEKERRRRGAARETIESPRGSSTTDIELGDLSL